VAGEVLPPSSWLKSDPSKKSKQRKVLFSPEHEGIACHISEVSRLPLIIIAVKNLDLTVHKNLVHVST
jgi:hypothetical protein